MNRELGQLGHRRGYWRTVAHRINLRLEDDSWSALERICRLSGVTVTAWIEAATALWKDDFESHNWKLPSEWGKSNPLIDRYQTCITTAREIDASRRARANTGTDAAAS